MSAMMEINSRQRLRPWLIGQLDSSAIPGLIWLPNDKGEIDRTKFRIPWKHGGKHDWTPDQSRVFKEWAIHTGKYREGVDEETFAKWKTNLRCALNKASDIQEVVEESQKEADNPFKVYRFLPRKMKTGHKIHKHEYGSEEAPHPNKCDLPGVPRHIASYSSSGSSLSSRSMPSVPGRGLSVGQNSMTSQQMQDLPSDLQELRSDSLRRVTEGMSSLDAATYLKEEVMDFEDDRQSSDGLAPTGLHPQQQYPTQPLFTETQIKQEIIDSPSPAEIWNANGMQNAALMQQPQNMFTEQLLNMADNSPQPASVFYGDIRSPESVTRASETSENSQQGFVPPSPPFSNASSPYAVAGNFGSPSPSPTHHFVSTCATTQPYNTISTAQSPQNAFTAISPAPSPQQPFNSPVVSPQGHAEFPADGTQNGENTKGEQIGERDCFVNRMASLDMSDVAPPMMRHLALLSGQHMEDVDIGHKCVQTADACAMTVQVYYQNQEIIREHVTQPDGCIIAYNPFTQQQGRILDESGLSFIKEKVYDQKPGRMEIALPEWKTTGDAKRDQVVQNLLKNAGRGIVIECKNGDVFAKRLCKTSVYYATHFDDEKYAKLNREENAQEQVKVFDYRNVFEPALQHCELEARVNCKNEVKIPKPDVYLFIGQHGTPSNAHLRYVYIKITSCTANRRLKMMERSLYSITAEVSNSDGLDRIDNQIRQEFNK